MLESIGRYSIREQVSQGDRGTTTVYRAYDEDRERQVALKLLVPEIVLDLAEDLVQTRLRRAAEASSFLNHAAIARVRDVGFQDGYHFVSTDFVEGVSAFDLVAEHGPMPLPEALRLVMDVLAGLGYAHSQGVIHGDVKLENVMLRRDGSAVLTDYGALKDFAPDGAPVEDRWASSITSLSPEQILGEEVGPASDLYGLGVVFFELLTGDSAFPVREGEDPWEAARRRVELPPPGIPARDPDLPRELDDFFGRALARDPQSRFESASDMTRSLIALAVRYRLDIPDAVPVETVPGRYQASRESLRGAMHALGGGVVLPSEPAKEMGEDTRKGLLRRRKQAWVTNLCFLGMVFAVWWVLLTRVGYLSVSSFPPGAEVTLVPEDESVPEFSLGPSPVLFHGLMVQPGKLRLTWPANPPRVVEVPLEGLDPRTHLQINASPETTAIRRLRVELPGWLAALLDGGAEAEEVLELRSQAVDAQADKLLLARKLEEAAKIYVDRIREDPALRRQAADRLVEVAYLRQGKSPRWAVEALKKAVQIDGDHGRGHVILGILLRDLKDEGALYHLHKGAQRLAPGSISDLPEDLGEALDVIRSRLFDRPDDVLLRRWEAHLLRQKGELEASALRYLRLALDRSWDRPAQY